MIARKNLKAGVVLETILILAGLGLITKAAIAGLDNYKFLNNADTQTVTGTVTATGNYGLRLTIQFNPSGSNEFVGFSQDGMVFNYNIGDKVDVLYNPNDPAGTRMRSFGALWYQTLLFGFFGLILFGTGIRLRAARNL